MLPAYAVLIHARLRRMAARGRHRYWNGGSTDSQDRLREIIIASMYLKSVGKLLKRSTSQDVYWYPACEVDHSGVAGCDAGMSLQVLEARSPPARGRFRRGRNNRPSRL